MIKKQQTKLTDERTSFKPFAYPFAYDAWLKHEQSHWLHTEVPMLEDVKDWKKKLEEFNHKEIVEIHATDPEAIKENLIIYKIHRTIILNADGTIKNGFVNLFDVNFENNL